MSDRIEAEILDALGEEVDAAIDTPLVVIEGTKGEPGADDPNRRHDRHLRRQRGENRHDRRWHGGELLR